MKRSLLSRFIIFLFCLFLPIVLNAEANYWGTTGLMRIPNGRLISDGDLRFTFSQSYPYRNYCVTFGFLPFLELNGHLLELVDHPTCPAGKGAWKGYGNYKDKIADFKLQLFQEKKDRWWPSLAIGVEDLHGTQLFHTQYVAASKRFGPVDVTLGYGGHYFDKLTNSQDCHPRELDGAFGGMEWRVHPNLSLLAEYDPTKTLIFSQKEVDSHWNWGLRWKPWRWLNLGYSYQRGKEHGFRLSITYPFGKPLLPQKPDYPFFGPVNHRSILSSGIKSRLSAIRNYLIAEGFSDVKVVLSHNFSELYVEYQNDEYLSQVKALGRALRVIVAQTPSDIQRIHIIIKSRNVPLVRVSLNPEDFIALINGKISVEKMQKRTEISSLIPEYGTSEDFVAESKHPNDFSYRFKPIGVESYINDPSGFYKARVGPTIWAEKELHQGLAGFANLRFPVYSNISTTMPPMSTEPIRSDIVNYLEHTGLCVENLVLDNVFHSGNGNFWKATLGYLELQFAGASIEHLRTFKNGRFGFGSEITWSKKRSPDSIFGLEDFSTVTPFLKGYAYIPEFDLTLQTRVGRFLAGDKGVRFEVIRYIRGASVFLWYTRTDTTNFTGPNKGYFDKGVGFTIPVRIFHNYDCRGSYGYGMSAWSRDVGQIVEKPTSIYDFIREFSPVYISSHWKEIVE